MTNPMNSMYAVKIFKLAEDRTDEIFYNSSAEHAIIVHQALIKNASRYVCIFSSSMCSEISNNNEYCNFVDQFLKGDKDRYINILLTDCHENFDKMPIAQVLAKYPLQVVIKKYAGQALYNDKPVHFTVSDDRAFRLETDIEKHMAFGNFNSTTQAQDLKTVFNQAFQSPIATPVCLCN